jgi:hypothetical protein
MHFVIISVVCGILLWLLGAIINRNPFAQKLYQVYAPILKQTYNIPISILANLFYGFVFSGMFLLLFKSLPGETTIIKGISFALIVWFLRGVMSALSQWTAFALPFKAVIYAAISGLCEMLIVGVLFSLTLKP